MKAFIPLTLVATLATFTHSQSFYRQPSFYYPNRRGARDSTSSVVSSSNSANNVQYSPSTPPPPPSPPRSYPSPQPRQYGQQYPEHPAQYSFEWQVKDDYSGNDYGHQENRQDKVTSGQYYVLLPDGRRQKVVYTVDGYNGYQAEVTYEGEAQYPVHQQQNSYQPAPRTYNPAPAPAPRTYNPVPSTTSAPRTYSYSPAPTSQSYQTSQPSVRRYSYRTAPATEPDSAVEESAPTPTYDQTTSESQDTPVVAVQEKVAVVEELEQPEEPTAIEVTDVEDPKPSRVYYRYF